MNFDKAMNNHRVLFTSIYSETIWVQIVSGDKFYITGLIPLLKRDCVEEMVEFINIMGRTFIDIMPLRFEIVIGEEFLSLKNTNFMDIFFDIVGDLIEVHDKLWS
jgi:hypothetical protein